ncbi:DUF3526 domain-containing protein, partial [Anditalea andensis]|uniref:ABC transporter permease n=1 Tax=Anditalea andensis TaxID=1048983 RepID=A0A074L0V7_9BACT
MTPFKKTFTLEGKQFVRSRITWLGFAIVFIIGVYAIFHGKILIAEQQKVINQVDAVQEDQLRTHIIHNADQEVGALLYYQFFYTKNEPSKWAAFSVGQRDINAYTLKVRMLAVEGQLYDTELSNPNTLLSGNLDLSFVIIFLFPLLIISLCFNILSGEQESGIWALVASQPVSEMKVLLMKFLVRFLPIFILMGLLLTLSVLILNLPIDQPLFLIFTLSTAYIIFWFLVVYIIVLFRQHSNFNAVTLLSVWLLLVVLIPAFANVLVSSLVPIPEALATAVVQREAYHEKWDMPKNIVMDPFFTSYPQYSHYPIPEDRFSYGWYYAMMFAADKEANNSSAVLFDKLAKRQELGIKIGFFVPSLFLQNQFNRIAKTDLEDHVNYLRSVKAYHREISEFFYPYVFEAVLPAELDWDLVPKYSRN